MAFYDQPHLVQRMIADRVQFAKDLLPRLLATGALDFVQVWEDMAYKTASLISPRFVRQIMQPAYEELVALLRAGGVQIIMVDCDGHVNDLLSIYMAAGIDGTHPCEIAAGADPIELRRRYPGCTLIGGMDSAPSPTAATAWTPSCGASSRSCGRARTSRCSTISCRRMCPTKHTFTTSSVGGSY